MMIKTLILTSKQNFSWHSMQEIIPFLVTTWKEVDPSRSEVVDVDEVSMKNYLKIMMTAENVVLSCFTPSLYKVAAFIRNEVNSSARFFIHLHNQATIGCWPMRHWGGKDIFRNSDVFISSCSRDSECLKINYPDANVQIVPFAYKNLPSSIPNLHKSATIPFVFIGRISSQKNLHSLFLALRHLSDEMPKLDWSFDIFGKEDGLGSPNMGREDQEYKSYLKKLLKTLNLESRVHFQGFKDRSFIQDWLEKKKSIFIIPSLHSDENFGMAVFQSLIKGHLAILSDWGGHTDFKEFFPKQVYLSLVYKTPHGPFLNPLNLKDLFLKAITDYNNDISGPIPKNYLFESILEKNKAIINNRSDDHRILRSSEAADLIFKKIPANPTKLDQRIFESYLDPLAHLYLQAYGMKNTLESNSDKNNYIAPWISQNDAKTLVQDPHRGEFEFGPLSSDKVQKLLRESGFIYS